MKEDTVYNQPVRNLQKMLQTIARHDEHYDPVTPDGVYGTTTTQAVSHFQQNQGLPVTGIADQETWERVADSYAAAQVDAEPAWPIRIDMPCRKRYRSGECCSNISLMQCMLACLSERYHAFAKPDMSGTFDETTGQCVKDFQHLCGLPETGEMDKCTWKSLAIQYSALSQP